MRGLTLAACCATLADAGMSSETLPPMDCLGSDELFDQALGEPFRDSMVYREGYCPGGTFPVWQIIDCETGEIAGVALSEISTSDGEYELDDLKALREKIRLETPTPSLRQIVERTIDLGGDVKWRKVRNFDNCKNLLKNNPAGER